jgi:hypothetical protein
VRRHMTESPASAKSVAAVPTVVAAADGTTPGS